ncbi:hypothetical protein J1N35_024999 [Gossypium stocksii]|uniref:Reverse transcriptase n=1 Tax=Gossypium stocksii TaxID=47602 RepID=A0A9D3V5T1_9ROSI|nr:hypothetical protein J1N35_024999 [Gossypium stocksii]
MRVRVTNVKSLLKEYKNCSGQLISFDKPLVYSSSNIASVAKLMGSAIAGFYNVEWRLACNPTSLVARVLKTKYYAQKDFMSSKLRGQPSDIWKRIWSTKGILLKGCCWQVGNDMPIPVWEATWLPGDQAHFIQSPRVNGIKKVADLINEQQGT